MSHRHSQSISVIFLFGGFLLSFFLLSVFIPEKTFSETENRYLAKRPAISWETVKDGSFGRDYERYLSDQFPFRNSFIGAKTLAEQAQFKKEINGVFLGKDGYLLEALYPEDLNRELYGKNLERLGQFAVTQAETLGKDHVRIMLVPSAAQILTDKLPEMAAPFDQEQAVSELELKLTSELGPEPRSSLEPQSSREPRSGLEPRSDPEPQSGFETRSDLSTLLVPVSSALETAWSENPGENARLYYRTDHHWTSYGAFIAYETWMKSLGMTPIPLEDFKVQTVSSTFHGTIYSKLNRAAAADSIQLFIPNNQPDFQVSYDGNGEIFNTLYSMDALKTKDQYRVFLDGNHGWTKILNPDSKSGRSLLIVKDSYAHCFAPFAALHFDQVHMLDLRYYNGRISDFIEEQNITDTLVLYQIPGFLKDVNLVKLNR